MPPAIGDDGHPIPEVQGVVAARVQPIHAKDLINLGQAEVSARGSALRCPSFARPPEKTPDGQIVLGTIECDDATLAQARNAAARVIAILNQLPLNESTVDVMNLAFAVAHYANKAGKS